MRPNTASHDQEQPQDLESLYSYDREGCASTLVYISTFGAAIAAEYLDQWRPTLPDARGVRLDLPRFEAWRFGAELWGAPHSLLLFHVLQRAYPDDWRFRRSKLTASQSPTPAWTPGEEYDSRAPRVPLADALPDMPHAPGRQAIEARVNHLKQQAAEAAEGDVIE